MKMTRTKEVNGLRFELAVQSLDLPTNSRMQDAQASGAMKEALADAANVVAAHLSGLQATVVVRGGS